MTLRQKLLKSDDPIDIICELNPKNCSSQDVIALINIRKCRKRDPLNFLALEAKWWLRDNLKILKGRFI